MHETRQLAEFVATTHFADLPPSLIEDFKIIVLDTFAAGMHRYRPTMGPDGGRVGPRAGGQTRSLGHQPILADRHLPRRPGQWGVDRRLRVRAAHRVARQRHRPARGTGRLRTRASGRQRASSPPWPWASRSPPASPAQPSAWKPPAAFTIPALRGRSAPPRRWASSMAAMPRS